MKLSKSNKDKLVGGIITIIILATTLFVKECFDKRNPKPATQQTEINDSSTIISKDTSNQKIAIVEQANSNNGNVTNEYVFGDKNINKTEPKSPQVSRVPPKQNIESPETNIEKIENNGNLSIGQTGGTVTQTTIINPTEKFTNEEKREIIKNINLKYRAIGMDGEICVAVGANQSHPKSFELSEDLKKYLKEQGYNVIESTSTFNTGGMTEKVRYFVRKSSCMELLISYF